VRDQRGFTLVELLVAMAAGIVVTSALYTILDVTLHQTTRTFSRVDATQRARTALEAIGSEMRSACVGNGIVPIKIGSTGTAVNFLSQYGSGVSPTPVWHTIAFDSASGKLTDTVYPVNGSAPAWTKGSPATQTKTLLTNVAQSGSTPVFQYFSTDAEGQTQLTGTLDENASEATSEVRMTLVVKPAGGSGESTNLGADTVTNSVVLRLTPFPNPGTPEQTFLPCE
jgi:prepilin-type N-terminal cleavage/methylation domain-containing protein